MRLLSQELPYDPNQVTPGVIGFVVTALLAVVVMLLLWDFNRRVRRINDREEIKERLQAELAASERLSAAASSSAPADGDAQAPSESTAEPEAPQPPRG